MRSADAPRGSAWQRGLIREIAGGIVLLLAFAIVALAFLWPWMPHPGPGGASLDRYFPFHDGWARLSLRAEPDGRPRSWTSENLALIAPLQLYGDLRKAPSDAILDRYGVVSNAATPLSDWSARLAGVEIYEARVVDLDLAGRSDSRASIYLRDSDGISLLGFSSSSDNRDLLFDPPLLMLPADPALGRSWASEGRFGTARYVSRSEIVEAGALEARVGHFEDCLRVRTTLQVLGAQEVQTASAYWTCAGIGPMQTVDYDADGNITDRVETIAGNGLPTTEAALPPAQRLVETSAPSGDPASWKLTRVGRVSRLGEATESTIPPVWLPTAPPMVLVAGYNGDLVAFDTEILAGNVRWRFHPQQGAIYSPPGIDPSSGRVYVGATDKRLYALDPRGLFLWSFLAGDNIASRPLVVGPTVVFGSEDRTVYGLDATSGALRWRTTLGGAIVSSPALAGETIVLGSDDQHAYGLDPATGEIRWTYAANEAIEAPTVAAGGMVYVVSRDGTVAALDPAACSADCSATWEASIGYRYRTPPAVAEDRLFVVDETGVVAALAREAGQRLWVSEPRSYVGPPLVLGGNLFVASQDGTVTRMGFDGELLGRWSAADAGALEALAPSFTYGPIAGGSGIWIVDTGGVLRRIGPPAAPGGIPMLAPLWLNRAINPPFNQNSLEISVARYGGQAVVLDSGHGFSLVDPSTGKGIRRGTLPGQGSLAAVDPLVYEDVLFAVVGDTLNAASLADGHLIWQARGSGQTLRPPVIADDILLWLSAAPPDSRFTPSTPVREGALRALDRTTGSPRWQAAVSGAFGVGGAVVAGDAVFISSPPARFDLATGQERWRLDPGWLPLGGPALTERADTLFVGLFDPGSGGGAVIALDTAAGSVRWWADLGGQVLSLRETLWVSDDTVIVPTVAGKIITLDAQTGAERWRFDASVARFGALTVDDGRVIFALENAQMIALDARNGRPLGRLGGLQLDLTGQASAQRPVVVSGVAILPLGNVLLGFESPRAGPP